MPIPFRSQRRLISTKKTATYYVTEEFFGRNICIGLQETSDENGVIWFAVQSTDDGNRAKKKPFKALGKIKSFFRKRKTKLCKQCMKVNKICKCKLVLKSLLNTPSGNVNHSASGPDSTFNNCKLKSYSCTAINESKTTESTSPLMYRENGSIPSLQKFCTYIPIRKVWGPLYPKGYVGDSRKVWLDMQMWYSRYYEQMLKHPVGLDTSKSENSIHETRTTPSFLNTDFDASIPSEHISIDIEQQENKSCVKQRFLLRPNSEYISMVRFYSLHKCRMQLFIHYAGFDDIIHLKTEMLVSCMRSFLLTDGDFEVLWIADMATVLPARFQLIDCPCIKLDVALELATRLPRAEAVLFVSRSASILLRHQDTCFLESLSMAAGLDRGQLIVLPDVLNRCEVDSSRAA